MFGGRDEDNTSHKAGGGGSASILGAGSHFSGTIKTRGTLRVEGEFEGEAECKETLEVGKTGVVKANLNVKDAVIAGKVYGNIKATSRIELQSGSHLEGDIVTKRLVIDEGVFFEGNCKMGEKRDHITSGSTKSGQAAKSDQGQKQNEHMASSK
ncbi:MAG: polymer-forming cytoskeletal protein [bacterium]|nr:polymer-forming cytoskeletal protein [bacterium]